MSYPRRDESGGVPLIYAVIQGFFAVAAAILVGLIGFTYYEAVRTLLTWGPSEFNMSVLGFTAIWALVAYAIYYRRNYGS